MKTLITTFAFAVMTFSFNPSISMASGETNEKTKKAFTEPIKWIECNLAGEGKPLAECNQDIRDAFSENESDDNGSERETADSGDEGSTSAASADEQ